MRKGRTRLVKALIIATLLAVAIPPSVDFEHAFASSKITTVRSVNDIQQVLLSAMNGHQVNVEFVYKGKTNSLKTQLKQALDQAMESDPYINYTIASYGYSYRGSHNTADVSVKLSYRETAAETAYVEKQVNQVLKEIIIPSMNDHEKVKAIHDWIVTHLKYDTTLQKYTAFDGLNTGSTVCQGYSLLTYKMLKEAGIENRIVEGTATPEGSNTSQLHAWNLVLLSGSWYHLDTTWDDPVPDQKDVVGTEYYLRNDKQMHKDHSWTKPYPAATTLYRDTLSILAKQGGSKAAFYKKLVNDLQYHLYEQSEIVSSTDQLVSKTKAVINKGNHSLLFRFQGNEAELIDELQQLYKLGIEGISYHHSPFEETGDLKVYITWK
ncbi:transglutaminase domain-containing protein [Paenibacillus crassostreae]|uniref:Transglutaminase n=1 Tax=Paenibacillus crassostreae TaxID=1763538 RepID=A0A167ETT9_9BACL|nr:transglutaminase domain-containing protein [Paenibacillus crassostreae]AOZ93472.1 transglutaminase [Paenibacillus crassostreae]OAB75873.1 transglutaminase [Paenibacillus crassostreae]